MKKRLIVSLLCGLGAALLQFTALAQDHGHLNVGALGKQQDSALTFANGNDFIATSGYVKTLEYTNAARFAGYYQGNITLTALPTTVEHAGPDPAAAAPGSFIKFRASCSIAPPGGSFGFWNTGSTEPSLSLTNGESSEILWDLSQNDGSPGSDPYGHIHGRRFTATKPGLYGIEFTAVDTSTNGVGGGPIHKPSTPLGIWFQAGVFIEEVEPDEEEQHVHVLFGAQAGYVWQVESRSAFDALSPWQPVGDSVVGTDYFAEVLDLGDPGEQRFYRLKGTVTVTP